MTIKSFAMFVSILTWVAAAQAQQIQSKNDNVTTDSARDFGVRCDGSTDDARAINSAIEMQASRGGGNILLPPSPSPCVIKSTLHLLNNTRLVGGGGAPLGACATTILWQGATGGTAIDVVSITHQIAHAGLMEICIDGNNNLAAIGLNLIGSTSGDFENIRITNTAQDAVYENVTPYFGDQGSYYHNIQIVQTGNSNGWTIGAGTESSNTNFNHYDNINIQHKNGVGFYCGHVDSLLFTNLAMFRPPDGTGYSFVAEGGSPSIPSGCNDNVFVSFSPEGGFHAVGGSYPSVNNAIYGYITDNAPPPVVDPGARLSYQTANGAIVVSSGATIRNSGNTPLTIQRSIKSSNANTSIAMQQENSFGSYVTYADIAARSMSVIPGSETGGLIFQVIDGGVLTEYGRLLPRLWCFGCASDMGGGQFAQFNGSGYFDGLLTAENMSDSGLNASSAVYTDAHKHFTNIAPAGYSAVLSGTTKSIGGSALPAGGCTSDTVPIDNSSASMAVVVTPTIYPGDGISWRGYVSSGGIVTVKVCASVAATPTPSTYNVRVLQ